MRLWVTQNPWKWRSSAEAVHFASAFELTRPEHQGKYHVTVYQLGRRLGCKGVFGRGPAGRIEEHGLHVWQGYYKNAFRLMRECTKNRIAIRSSVVLLTGPMPLSRRVLWAWLS